MATYSVAGTILTVKTPINSTIAPPGNYMVFAVSASGRPSQGVYIGLGGAVPAPAYTTPRPTPYPDGLYTIKSTGAAIEACPYLAADACGGSGNTYVGKTAGVA